MQNQIDKMLDALMKHMGLIQWVDCWAHGENEGGQYVVLFNSRANFSICKVYQEKFHKLPEFIRDSLKDAPGYDVKSDRQWAQRKGVLVDCPRFSITRYKLNHDDEKAKWYFGDVLWIAKSSQSRPQATTPAPTNGRPAQRAPAAAPPGDWLDVETGQDLDEVKRREGMLADLRASIEGAETVVTLGYIADRAEMAGLFPTRHDALKKMGEFDFPPAVKVEMTQRVSVKGGLQVWDWLVEKVVPVDTTE